MKYNPVVQVIMQSHHATTSMNVDEHPGLPQPALALISVVLSQIEFSIYYKLLLV